MSKSLFYFLIIVITILQSCKQHSSETIKENQLVNEYPMMWNVTVLNLGSKEFIIYHTDDSIEFKSWKYKDSLTEEGKIGIPVDTKTKKIKLKTEEVDSIYLWVNKLITEFAHPKKFCTDYAGYLELTIIYDKQIKKSCEYKSICEWKTLSPETQKLNSLFKNRFEEFE